MKRICRSTALAVAAGIFFSAALHAQVVQHGKNCNGCTEQQIQALLPNCAQGYQYVADFDADHLYLGCYKEKGVRPTVKPYLGIPVQKEYVYRQAPASEQNTFQAYQGVYARNGHVMAQSARVSVNVNLRPVLSLGDDGYMNAYDMVKATQNSDAVENWLMTTIYAPSNTKGIPFVSPQLSTALVTLLNDIKTGIVSFDFSINLTLVFHDGSQAIFAFDPHSGTWSHVPGSARDGHGNLIPDSYESTGGNNGTTYNFTNPNPGYDLTNFLNTLQLDDVQPQGSPTKVLACVTVNKTVTCHYVTLQK